MLNDVGAAVLLVAAVLCILSLLSWRAGALALLIAVCFEGVASRLWPALELQILFGKALWALPIYAGWFMAAKRAPRGDGADGARVIGRVAMIFLGLSVVHLFNPRGPGLGVGVIGLGVFWAFFPMLFVGARLASSRDTLLRVFTILMCVSVPVTVTGIAQAMLAPGSMPIAALEAGAGVQWTVNTVSGARYPRPPATFTFISQFGQYLLFVVPVAFGLLRQGRSLVTRLVSIAAVTAALPAVMIHGSRAGLLIVMMALAFMIAITSHLRDRLIFLVTAAALVTLVFPLAGDVFLDYSGTIAIDLPGRFYHVFVLMPSYAFSTTVLGLGAGVASPATRYLAPPAFFPEAYWVKILLEYGLPGLAAFILLLAVIIREGWRSVRLVRDTELRFLASGLFAFILVTAIGGGIVFGFDQTPTSLYFWFFVGVLTTLPRIDTLPARRRHPGRHTGPVPAAGLGSRPVWVGPRGVPRHVPARGPVRVPAE